MNSSRPSHLPGISLLHATRGRPDLALAARAKWLQAAAHPERVEHIFAVDCDDKATQEAVAGLLHRVVPEKGGGCVAAWNLAAEASSGDVLVQLSDDWAPVPGWDEEFVRRLRDVSQSAVLRPSDGHRRDDLLCMAILTRARLVQQGEFLHHGYLGVFSDDEFSFRAYLDGVVIDARDLVLTHHHPFYDSSVVHDETYAQQNDPNRSSSGRDLFLHRNPEAMGHWLQQGSWERFFVPLAAHVSAPAPAKERSQEIIDVQSKTIMERQQKALLRAQDLFLKKSDHVALFRVTALQAKSLLEGVRKSLLGRLVLKKARWQLFLRCIDGARLRVKRRSMLEAACSYLQATRIGLELLHDISGHLLAKSKSLSTSIDQLQAQHRSQRKWLRRVQRLMDDLPQTRAAVPWGFDLNHYTSQCGDTFNDAVKAARHYDKEGWRAGLNPHSLFDTRRFQSQNAAQIDPQWNPLEEYHRLLDEGESPEAHPKFPGAWLRDFFLHSFALEKTPPSGSIPDPPVDAAAAGEFSRLEPVLVMGVFLAHTAEEDLQRFLLALGQASRRAVEAGLSSPVLLISGSSEKWNDAASALSKAIDVKMRFVPSSPHAGFAQAHNELMRTAFGSEGATHYWCLHPEICLHPEALVEMKSAIKSAGLPALIEGRQFPQENAKEYDAPTLQTNWGSAACLLIPRFLFEMTGGFDEHFLRHGADIDLCWRTWQKGYRCLVAPSVLFGHHPAGLSNESDSEKLSLESGRILAEKWRAPKFRLECERALIEHGHYPGVPDLPVVPHLPQQDPHQRVDFEHQFTFAQARW